MEEKKLTDEEIVKALECCMNKVCGRTEDCPLHSEKDCIEIMSKNALDLIHRLQGDKSHWEERWKEQVEETDELKAEIERLTKKRKYILANKVYSDTTLKGWKKEDLIEQIRILEHNWASAEESLNIQAENCEMLLKQTVKDTVREIVKWIKLNGTLEYGGYVIHDSTIEQICKKYGVEVEV